jgi:predicted HTH transcriptional regulator
VEREFRSFEKPERMEIAFKLGEPGTYTYDSKVGKVINNSPDAVMELLGMAGQMTDLEIKESLSLTRKQLDTRLEQLLKQDKITKEGDLWKIKS